MTGLASSRWASSSARRRAAASSSASSSKRNDRPARTVVHLVEAESRQRPLDGGALGIGDPGPQPDLDAAANLIVGAPYQSARRRPVTRS